MQKKVASGEAENVEEADCLTWEQIYEDVAQRKGQSVEEVREEFEEQRRQWREGRYYQPRPRS